MEGCIHADQSGGAPRAKELPVFASSVDGVPFLYSPNFSSRQAYSPGPPPRVIVIHDMEASYSSGVAWLRDRRASASAHFCVSSAGQSCQLVREEYAAWHVAWCNGYTFGIEHEGFAATSSYYTDAMLKESARIAADLCRRYDIPPVHSTTRGICFHSDLGARGGGHHDPGPYWPMEKYISYVQSYLGGKAPARGGWMLTKYNICGENWHGTLVAHALAGAFEGVGIQAQAVRTKENIRAAADAAIHAKHRQGPRTIIVGSGAKKLLTKEQQAILAEYGSREDISDILDASGSGSRYLKQCEQWIDTICKVEKADAKSAHERFRNALTGFSPAFEKQL